MRPVIGFCQTKSNFISKIIIYFQRWIILDAKWSHVYFSYDEHLIYESTFPVVKLSKKEKYKNKLIEYTEYSVDVPFEIWTKAVRLFMDKYDETGYGIGAIFGFIWVYIVRKLFNKEIQNPSKEGTVCSELGFRFLQFLDERNVISMTSKTAVLNPDSIAPMELEAVIKSNHKIFVEIKK